jgi:hypothetical protein
LVSSAIARSPASGPATIPAGESASDKTGSDEVEQDESGPDERDAESEARLELEDVRDVLGRQYQVYALMQEKLKECGRLSDTQEQVLEGRMRDLRRYVEREGLLDEETLRALPEKIRDAKNLEPFEGCGDDVRHLGDAVVLQVMSVHRRLADLGVWRTQGASEPLGGP